MRDAVALPMLGSTIQCSQVEGDLTNFLKRELKGTRLNAINEHGISIFEPQGGGSTVSAPSPQDVQAFIRTFLLHRFESQERSIPPVLADDCDLLLSGYIDSLGLLELVAALSEFTEREIDFEALDPEKMTVVGPLSEFVSAHCAQGPSA